VFSPSIVETVFNDVADKKIVVFNSGEQFCEQGTKPKYIFQILSGVVFIKALDSNGVKKFIDFAGKPEFIGLSNCVMDTPYNFEVYAFNTVKAIQIKKEVFKHYLDNEPNFAANILYLLTKETASREGRLFSLINLQVYHRIGYLILRLAELFGYDESNKIPVQITIEMLCQLSGSTVSTVYNALNKLRLKDCCYFEDNAVYIINYDNLKYQLQDQGQVLMY
jgi:CRP-like cAMP-binding protein